MASAQETYRQEFRQRILALGPHSILEVGCGAGGFFSSLAGWHGRLTGIDPDAERIAQLKSHGRDAIVGVAENLPFDDAQFDVVVSSYTAHHLPDWPAATREALRVARHAYCVLDAWYDESIASQRVAVAYDHWTKEIDRAGGMVHKACLSLEDMIAPLPKDHRYTIDAAYRLVLSNSSLSEIESYSQSQLAKVSATPSFKQRYEAIMKDAARNGLSHDGALMVTIRKT